MRPPRHFRMFGYDRSRLPNAQLATLEEGVRDVEEAERRTDGTIGYPGWGVLYYVMLSHLRPDRENLVIETGTNVGCSTIVLAQALADSGRPGRVHTIEIDPKKADTARANIEAAGLTDRVTQHVGDSRVLLPRIIRDVCVVRAAFLDGSHLHDDVIREFEAVEAALDPGGLVIFDNTYRIAEPHEDQRVFGALKVIRERWGGNLVNLEFVSWYTPGLAFWQREAFTLD